jgi:phage-related protein
MLTFSPPIAPTPNMNNTKQVTPNLIVNKFGDNYTQRINKGLNGALAVCQLYWDMLSADQRSYVESFCYAVNDGQAWLYTLPRETVVRKFYLVSFKVANTNPLDDSFWMNIEEVADL